jgi:hypothetical protein
MKGRVKAAALAARGVAIAAAASLAILPIIDPAPGQTVGVNAAIRNRVLIRGAGTPQPRPAVLRQRVGLNDEVQTGGDSQLQVLLLDRSVLTVGANARFSVDRFVFDPRRNARSLGAAVIRGAFRFMSGRQLGLSPNAVSIRTPVATIGIRGTILEGVVGSDAIDIAARESAVGPGVGGDAAAASLIILRGPGPRTQGNGHRGVIEVQAGTATVLLDRPSFAVYIPRRGAVPIGPFAISRAGLARMQQLLVPPILPVPTMAIPASRQVPPGDRGTELAQGRADGQGPAPAAGQAPPAGSGEVAHQGSGAGLWALASLSVAALILVIAASDGGSPMSP